jgi:pimeloyl-ACP methyl ester carboxylesterase
MLQEWGCRTTDGHQLRVQGAPASAGYPVFVHPGTPGSRHMFVPTVDAAADHGLRLICWDRPGYGERPGRPGRRTADVAQEAEAVAVALGVSRFATWGFSGGGAYALACAALLPQHVSGAVVMAGLAPYDAPGLDWTGHLSPVSRAEVELFFTDPGTARDRHRIDADDWFKVLSRPEGWWARWRDQAGKDEAHSPAVADHLALVFHEAMRRGDEGWWEDWSAALSPWCFDVRDIRVPVQLWYGVGDLSVGAEHGRWLAEHIPGVDAHFLEGEDHTNLEALHQTQAWTWLVTTASD